MNNWISSGKLEQGVTKYHTYTMHAEYVVQAQLALDPPLSRFSYW